MRKRRVHYFSIDERRRANGRSGYLWHFRQFWNSYLVHRDGTEEGRGEFHLETIVRGKLHGDFFSAQFHIGNRGSETPWDGHLIILGIGFYWGWSGARKLAEKLSQCSDYPYDGRTWSFRISDSRFWWEIANHSDMCAKHRIAWGRSILIHKGAPGTPGYGKKRRRPRRTFQAGSINLSIPEALWGPKRFTYKTLDSFATLLRLPDGEYPVIIDLQRTYLGRTRVPQGKHSQSYTLQVDAPSGVPTHVDHSGGWKGDRSYGWGVDFHKQATTLPRDEWKHHAEAAVRDWVLAERARTGFTEPDMVE